MKSNLLSRFTAFCAVFLLLSFGASAQKNFFQAAPELKSNFSGKNILSSFSLFKLDVAKLRSYLSSAPVEFSNSSKHLLLEIPLPNGSTEVFDMTESSILSPKIAAEHPEIKSYSGTGKTHSNYVIRISLTSSGLNAIIVGLPSDEVYIERDEANSVKNVYVVYYGSVSKRSEKSKAGVNKCGAIQLSPTSLLAPTNAGTAREAATGGTLRTFRLAIAATAEFTTNRGGTQALAFNAIVGYVNRMNAVYRQELSVAFTLVSGTNLVYTTPGVPYNNADQVAMLTQNQTNVDNVIGTANYDVAHVFSYEGGSGGGIAASPAACVAGQKAQGASGVGDGTFAAIFDDQLVCHEVGHMFGMSHSYNSSIPVCTTREPLTSVEPGSGTTIMSYGYTCSNATGNDDYESPYQPILNFHTVNYKQAAD